MAGKCGEMESKMKTQNHCSTGLHRGSQLTERGTEQGNKKPRSRQPGENQHYHASEAMRESFGQLLVSVHSLESTITNTSWFDNHIFSDGANLIKNVQGQERAQ
jgi:hypothetical protein